MINKKATALRQQGVDVITIARDLFNRQEAFDLYDEVKRAAAYTLMMNGQQKPKDQ